MSNMEPTIQYTIREVFQEIKDQLSEIKEMMQGKADQAELDSLRARIHSLETWRYKIAGGAFAISTLVGAGAGVIVNILGGS